MMVPLPDGYVAFGEDDTFIGHIGPVYVRRTPGAASLLLALEKRHTNPAGTAHGGLVMTLLDITMGSNAGAAVGHVGTYPTIQLSCSLMAGARLGEVLIGEAEVTTVTRTLAFVSGRIRTGDRIIATASAVFRNPPGVEIPRRPTS